MTEDLLQQKERTLQAERVALARTGASAGA